MQEEKRRRVQRAEAFYLRFEATIEVRVQLSWLCSLILA